MQRLEAWLFEFLYPAHVDLVDGNRVEVVQLLPSPPFDGDEIRCFEQPEVLCDRLPRHVEALAQFGQRLAAAFVQPVDQHPPARIREGFEHFVDLLHGPSVAVSAMTLKGRSRPACCMIGRQTVKGHADH